MSTKESTSTKETASSTDVQSIAHVRTSSDVHYYAGPFGSADQALTFANGLTGEFETRESLPLTDQGALKEQFAPPPPPEEE